MRYSALVVALLAVNYGLLTGLTALAVPLIVAKLVTEVTLVALSYTAQSRFVFGGGRPRAIASRTPIDDRRVLAASLPYTR